MLGSHIVQFSTSELCVLPFISFLFNPFIAIFFSSCSHDVVLPIWKSNVSLSLMIDKKAKRFFQHNLSFDVKSLNFFLTVRLVYGC